MRELSPALLLLALLVPATASGIVTLGGFQAPGSPRDLEVAGDRAFLADAEHGLRILDVSDPAAPVQIGLFPLPGAQLVEIAGDVAYVNDAASLRVVDVSNPTAPVQIGSLAIAITQLHVEGARAYVNVIGAGLQILGLTNPANPVPLGSHPQFSYGLDVVDGIAYLTAGADGLKILSVANPGQPVLVGSLDTPGYANDVVVERGVAFVTEGGPPGRVRVVDVTDPSAPVELGHFGDPGGGPGDGFSANVEGIELDGHILYVQTSGRGLATLDVSNPTQPELLATFAMVGNPRALRVVAGRIYVSEQLAEADPILLATEVASLLVLDASHSDYPRRISSLATPDAAGGIAVRGGLALVTAHSLGLLVVDVAEPAAPVQVGALDTPGTAFTVRVAGDLAYVADGPGGLRVVSFAAPSSPVELGSFEPGGDVDFFDVAVRDGLAYVLDRRSGLRILDVGDPTAPFQIGFFPTPDPGASVHLAGSRAYVFAVEAVPRGPLHVVDVSDPAAPVEIGYHEWPSPPKGMAAVGDLVFVLRSWLAYVASGGLHIYDFSDPMQPIELGAMDSTTFYTSILDPGTLRIVGDRAFVVSSISGVHAIDVSDPSAPRPLAGYDHAKDSIRFIELSGPYVYFSTPLQGMHIAAFGPEITGSLAAVPALAAPARGALLVLLGAGALVALLRWGRAARGRGALTSDR
jgi:hypothetical protein